MEKTVRMSLLLDFYGTLLTKRQQDVHRMYFDDDLSLGEIASQLDISRQAVYDMLRRSQSALEQFETNLKLLSRYTAQEELLTGILGDLHSLKESLVRRQLTEEVTTIDAVLARIHQVRSDS